MSNCYRQHPGDFTGKGDPALVRGCDRSFERCLQVDAPMSRVGPGRVEAAYDRPGYRRGETGTGVRRNDHGPDQEHDHDRNDGMLPFRHRPRPDHNAPNARNEDLLPVTGAGLLGS